MTTTHGPGLHTDGLHIDGLHIDGTHSAATTLSGHVRPEQGAVWRLVVVSGGVGDPSSTRLLADRIAARTTALATHQGRAVDVTTIDLRELSNEISTALVSRLQGPKLTTAVAQLAQADGIVVAAPVYQASVSGLVASFFHVLDTDLLIGKPVVLAATAGTTRHALVIDDQMRPLFAYLRTLVVPTSVFAAGEDWNSAALGSHIDRAARELVVLMASGFAQSVRDESWGSYSHEYGSAGGTELGIDLDSDLMRLATGGTA